MFPGWRIPIVMPESSQTRCRPGLKPGLACADSTRNMQTYVVSEEERERLVPLLLAMRGAVYALFGMLEMLVRDLTPSERALGALLIVLLIAVPFLISRASLERAIVVAGAIDVISVYAMWLLLGAEVVVGFIVVLWAVGMVSIVSDRTSGRDITVLAVGLEITKPILASLGLEVDTSAAAGFASSEFAPWLVSLSRIAAYFAAWVIASQLSSHLRQSREEADEATERYRRLVADSDSAVLFLVDKELVQASDAAARLFGVDQPSDLRGRSLTDFIPARDRRDAKGTLCNLIAARTPVTIKRERIVRSDGTEVVIEGTATPVMLGGKSALQLVLTNVTERERAERMLRDSEERFRAAFVNSATPFAIIEMDGTISQVNNALCALTGWSESELLGNEWANLLHPDDVGALVAVGTEGVDGGGDFHLEVRLIKRDGGQADCVLDGAVLPDRRGNPVRIFALARDVTEQRTAEAALRESEERYRTFFEQIPVALYRTTLDGEILDANRALAGLLGADDVDDLIGTSAETFYAVDGERSRLNDMLREHSVTVVESLLTRLDGANIWVRDTSRIVETSRGSHHEGSLVDVTARRRVEEELRSRAQQQEAVASLGQAALEHTDIQLTLDRSMAVIASVLGVTTVAVLEHGTDDAFTVRASRGWAGSEVLMTRSLASRTLSTAAPIVLRTPEEVRFSAPELLDLGLSSGVSLFVPGAEKPFGVLWAFSSQERIFSTDDVHFLVSVSNVLAAALLRHGARLRLEELVRSKDQFIASVSHELRTPLTVVAGMADELSAGWNEFGEAEINELLGLMVEQSRDMTDLIEDLLVAARADIGKVAVSIEEVDVVSEIESVLGSLRPDERLRVRFDGQQVTALADRVRLKQIVRNLVTNAIRYGGSTIDMVVTQGAASVSVVVKDDGPGIAERDRERIFEPYHVAHNSVGQPSSVGLGLTVSRKLAHLMGGSLTYRHDEGSTFELVLQPTPRPSEISLVDDSAVRARPA